MHLYFLHLNEAVAFGSLDALLEPVLILGGISQLDIPRNVTSKSGNSEGNIG